MIIDNESKNCINRFNHKMILDCLFDAVFVVDTEGIIVYWNSSCRRLTGFTAEEMLGQNFYQTSLAWEARDDDEPAAMRKGLKITLESGTPGTWKGYIQRKNGQRLPIESHISPLREDDTITGAIEIFRDASGQVALEKSHQEAMRLSQCDPLTGLYSRGAITSLLRAELERSRRYEQPLSLIMLDLDHFKQVNDKYGHDVGDQVLIQIGSMLLSNIREPDAAGRWGGEEFLIIVPGSDTEAAEHLAQRIRQYIQEITIPEIPGQISASFGVSQYCTDENRDSLIAKADKALYQAKENGRNQVVVAKSRSKR